MYILISIRYFNETAASNCVCVCECLQQSSICILHIDGVYRALRFDWRRPFFLLSSVVNFIRKAIICFLREHFSCDAPTESRRCATHTVRRFIIIVMCMLSAVVVVVVVVATANMYTVY